MLSRCCIIYNVTILCRLVIIYNFVSNPVVTKLLWRCSYLSVRVLDTIKQMEIFWHTFDIISITTLHLWKSWKLFIHTAMKQLLVICKLLLNHVAGEDRLISELRGISTECGMGRAVNSKPFRSTAVFTTGASRISARSKNFRFFKLSLD